MRTRSLILCPPLNNVPLSVVVTSLARRPPCCALQMNGCREIKRERVENERTLRRALEFFVDAEIARVHRLFNAMHTFATMRREKRERRARFYTTLSDLSFCFLYFSES